MFVSGGLFSYLSPLPSSNSCNNLFSTDDSTKHEYYLSFIESGWFHLQGKHFNFHSSSRWQLIPSPSRRPSHKWSEGECVCAQDFPIEFNQSVPFPQLKTANCLLSAAPTQSRCGERRAGPGIPLNKQKLG
jgi:hypothetical protein